MSEPLGPATRAPAEVILFRALPWFVPCPEPGRNN